MNYRDYVESENRFSILEKLNKSNKNKLLKQSEQDAINRRKSYKNQEKIDNKQDK